MIVGSVGGVLPQNYLSHFKYGAVLKKRLREISVKNFKWRFLYFIQTTSNLTLHEKRIF